MYLRNPLSMDTQERIRAHPMDAVALIGGCGKTVPAQRMGAAAAARARACAYRKLFLTANTQADESTARIAPHPG
jgi:dihydroxyacid dehydratase/phosphogluconate dehydratase